MTNFEVIGLTRLEIKPESTAPEANALATRLVATVCNQIAAVFLQTQTIRFSYS